MTKDPRDGDHPGTSGEWWDQPDSDSQAAGNDAASAGSESADSAGAAASAAASSEGTPPDSAQTNAAQSNPAQSGTAQSSAAEVADADEVDAESEVMAEVDQDIQRGSRGIWAWIGIAVALIILTPVVIFGVAYAATDVPEPDELRNDQIAIVYDRTGENEITRIVPEAGNRRDISLNEVPDQVRNAVLAAEDREFYTNPGFSLTGYARAAWGVVSGNPSAGGGSTITQQYVKNAVVGNDRTITRKAKEFVMSAKMAREWSKDQILEAYLNTIYFGRNGYGIAAASDVYFGKPISELTVEEGAVLAASIQRPSALDPWTNRAEAEQRWNYVLDGMVEMNVLDPATRAGMVYPETLDPAQIPQQAPERGPDAMIQNQVLNELDRIGISEQDVNTLGLRVTTTIDPDVQQAALNAVDSWINQESGLRSAVVSIEPSTGAVRAYYGGDDPNGWDYANSGLQTGSTFKIFTLAAALDQNIPLTTNYSSDPVQSGDATIYNSGGMTCGTCPISEALRQSLNTPFIRLQRDLKNGPDDTAAMAHRLGVAESIPGIERTLMEDNGHSQDGITLGQYLTRPLDMAVGLATLANDGVYQETHFVEKVETVDGETLFEREQSEGDRRVPKVVATNVIDAMKPIASYNSHALAGGRESAAKTGTAQLGDTGMNKDAWMIGATPQLSTAVWVGNVDGSALYNRFGGSMFGAHEPADIWKSTMDAALANRSWESFSTPEAVGGVAGAPAWGGYNQAPATGNQSTGEATGTTPTETAEPEAPSVPDLGELLPSPGGGEGDGGGGVLPPPEGGGGILDGLFGN